MDKAATATSRSASSEHGWPPALEVDRHALFLDLDGTIAEIAERPEVVRVDEDLQQLLRTLGAKMHGALAVITGRALKDADRILAGAVECISALHGQESRIAGRLRTARPCAALRGAHRDVERLAGAGVLPILIEDKGAAVALHFRHAPEHERLIRQAADELAEIHGLRALHGKFVAELLPQGVTKHDALLELMSHAPFGGRAPIAVGDDVTDEDAFRAAGEFGGFAIMVGPPRATAAPYRLPDVGAVRTWMAAAVSEPTR